MKLEQKHFLPYLPHGTGIRVFNNKEYHSLTLEDIWSLSGLNNEQVQVSEDWVFFEDCKLQLKPLSQVTEEFLKRHQYAGVNDLIQDIIQNTVSIEVYRELAKGGYDIFDLIKEGLAEPIKE